MSPGAFVFAYGSLVLVPSLVPDRSFGVNGFVLDLAGFARSWGVAMDNRRDVPGYKYYIDRHGRRPEVFVAYLDIHERAGASVNGVCIPVDDARLTELDARERNYERVDVSDRVGIDGARIWTYVGSAAGRRRLAQGRDLGRAVVDATYLAAVHEGFRLLGRAEYDLAAPSLGPSDLAVVALTRVELAPEAPA